MKEKNQILGLITISLLIFIGCSKMEQTNKDQSSQTPKLSKTEYGGCFLGKTADIYSDTIFYELNNDTLLLHVIVHKNCASNPLDSVVINQGNVKIYLKDSKAPNAYCTCDYRFTYLFTKFSTIQNFKVYYKDFGTTNYNLLRSLTFPKL